MASTSTARSIQEGRRLAKRGVKGDAVDQAKRRLPLVFAAYPGIVTGPAGSQLHPAGADQLVVACVFDDGHLGRAAALAVDFVMSTMGLAADADVAGGDAEAPTSYLCSAKEFLRFERYLAYGSELQVGKPRPLVELAEPPLPSLLGRALSAFTDDYGRARSDDPSVPQFAAWANALRVLDDIGLDQRELVRRAVISRRVAAVIVGRLERRGLLTVEAVAMPGKRGKTRIVRLTREGIRARDSAAALVASVERDWRRRFGDRSVGRLREATAAVVDRLAIELPHGLTGYGAGDPSVTGGDYIAEQAGPPRIPAHGQDWPVVLRGDASDAASLPLPALLSQALAAFAIDYERERLGSLQAAMNFMQFVSDDGIPLERAQALAAVTGNGKSLHERHLNVVVEPGRPRDLDRRVYLSPKGRRARDAYPHRVQEVDADWPAQFGDAVVSMQTELASMAVNFPSGPQDYPDTTAWIHRLWFD